MQFLFSKTGNKPWSRFLLTTEFDTNRFLLQTHFLCTDERDCKADFIGIDVLRDRASSCFGPYPKCNAFDRGTNRPFRHRTSFWFLLSVGADFKTARTVNEAPFFCSQQPNGGLAVNPLRNPTMHIAMTPSAMTSLAWAPSHGSSVAMRLYS